MIMPFTEQESGFYDSKEAEAKKEALQKILKEGLDGEQFLFSFLLRNVTISGGYFTLNVNSDYAHSEWMKKCQIVRALSATADQSIINKLTEILLCKSKVSQFSVYFQPAVAETLGKLKAYSALEKLIAIGQAVPRCITVEGYYTA